MSEILKDNIYEKRRFKKSLSNNAAAAAAAAKSFQSCLTLCDPVQCSPPGSSVHGILQASGLLCPPPGDLPVLGIQPVLLRSSALAGGFLPLAPPLEIYSLVDETKFSEKQDEEDDSDDGGEGYRHLLRTFCCQFLC